MKYFILGLFVILSTTLPYQAHGFNDLDYFKQLLRIGVDYFKLDISAATEESCQKHSTWAKG